MVVAEVAWRRRRRSRVKSTKMQLSSLGRLWNVSRCSQGKKLGNLVYRTHYKIANMTVGQSSLISLAHHCYD